jgi:hypothetical protein
MSVAKGTHAEESRGGKQTFPVESQIGANVSSSYTYYSRTPVNGSEKSLLVTWEPFDAPKITIWRRYQQILPPVPSPPAGSPSYVQSGAPFRFPGDTEDCYVQWDAGVTIDYAHNVSLEFPTSGVGSMGLSPATADSAYSTREGDLNVTIDGSMALNQVTMSGSLRAASVIGGAGAKDRTGSTVNLDQLFTTGQVKNQLSVAPPMSVAFKLFPDVSPRPATMRKGIQLNQGGGASANYVFIVNPDAPVASVTSPRVTFAGSIVSGGNAMGMIPMNFSVPFYCGLDVYGDGNWDCVPVYMYNITPTTVQLATTGNRSSDVSPPGLLLGVACRKRLTAYPGNVYIEWKQVPQVRLCQAEGMNTGQVLTVSGNGYITPALNEDYWQYIKYEAMPNVDAEFYRQAALANTDAVDEYKRADVERKRRR